MPTFVLDIRTTLNRHNFVLATGTFLQIEIGFKEEASRFLAFMKLASGKDLEV